LKFALLMNNGPTNYQVHPYSAPVVLATNGAANLVRREGAAREDYFMKGRKQYV
jgi:hypothetical protein